MGSDLTSGQIRRAQFRTSLRGADAAEVQAYLERVATLVEELETQSERLETRLGEYADRDLESEFDTLGREVTAVLQTAREAADSMRERASLDATRWRSESISEAEKLRKDARNDAEALRGDAWTTGTELLNQTTAEVKRSREDAEREVLTITGEAEREAHRLTSTARREAEDVTRTATMAAEKATSEANKQHDNLIEQAHRQAEAAQERTRALEERREELLEELENVRSTLGRLEGNLEERRDTLNLSSSSSSVKVVPSPGIVDPEIEDWQPGETVRIISPAQEEAASEAEASVVEVEAPAEPPPPVKVVKPEPEPLTVAESEPEPEPLTVAESEPAPQAPPVAEPEPVSVPEPEPVVEDDKVGALFASLRGGTGPTHTEQELPAAQSAEFAAAAVQPEAGKPPVVDAPNLIEQRDAQLLPITNRALRGIKKSVTEAQNIALDALRTDEAWQPSKGELADTMRADLIGLWAESYSAGHLAAEGMTGEKLKRPDTPNSTAAEEFGDGLTSAVSEALALAGDGQRERQSATSRVFRGWRTDEAERRVRELGLVGFHKGIIDSAGGSHTLSWVAAGTPCSACQEAASNPAANPPPVHAGCECTLGL
jgi:DivIVA domain-containing protein